MRAHRAGSLLPLSSGYFLYLFDDFLHQYMRNNLHWFQSPQPQSFNIGGILKQGQLFSDPPRPNLSSPLGAPSPAYARLILQQLSRHDGEPLGPKLGGVNKNGVGIVQIVMYSSDEEVTPLGLGRGKLQQLWTTARKSIKGGDTVKKSRPKDKGLRGIAMKALNTVIEMEKGTYKQVAIRLLASLASETNIQTLPHEETNIKRRVYDALNVLISLGLLKKQGRLIVGQKNLQDKRMDNIKEHKRFESLIAVKEQNLIQKRAKVKQASQKLKGISTIFQRNQKSNVLTSQEPRFIRFPFIGVRTSVKQWQLLRLDKELIEVKFKHIVHPFGDIDSIRIIPDIK